MWFKVMVVLLTAGLAFGGITVRVVRTPAGPQIKVNGEIVSPWMFFGIPSPGKMEVSSQWEEKSFEFIAPLDLPSQNPPRYATLHFRFGQVPGEVWLSDLRITDLTEGKDVFPSDSLASQENFSQNWVVWPPGEQNTVGKVNAEEEGLHILLQSPPDGKWPDFHIYTSSEMPLRKGHRYRISFKVRALPSREITPSLYCVNQREWRWIFIAGPEGIFEKQVAIARDAGVNFVSFVTPDCWRPGEPDWTPLDIVCNQILAINPKALLIPRIGVDAPQWWLEENPDAYMIYEGGQKGRCASVSHRGYRQSAVEYLEKLCKHLLETFPNNFAGIHICGQNTGEWFYEGTWDPPLSGYDPATLQAWREWLRRKGVPDADTAQVPDPASRHGAPYGLLRDPVKESQLIDFNRFLQEEMADMVALLASTARRATQGRVLILFFYGYHYEFGAVPNGAPVCGHYALVHLLKSAGSDIDILCSPISYFDREFAGTGPCMSSAESIMARGILWLNEDDTRTYLAEASAGWKIEEIEETKWVLIRNLAQEAMRGFGTWWMDLGGTGWFADPALWKEMEKLRPVEERLKGAKVFAPDIASFIGEDSMCHLAGGSHILSRPLIYEARSALGRCGAPYGQYLLEDAISGQVKSKLQFFLAGWSLTREEREGLRKNRSRGATRVWCYAPGYILPDEGADVSLMEEVTGFRHRPISLPTAEAFPTEEGRKLGLTQPWGPKETIRPLFTVEAKREEVLATYSDGSPALAVRRNPKGGYDVFLGVPQLTPQLVRALARLAGVHLYTDEEANVWARGDYLMVQGMRDGSLTIDVGKAKEVYDAISGKRLGKGPRITLPFRKGEVRLLRVSSL